MLGKSGVKETMDGIRGVITFFTIIPLGGSHNVEKAFGMSWTAPLIVPLITGLIPGFLGLVVWHLTGNYLVSASTAYTLLLILTGFNHIDGFADTVDALMVRDLNERLKVLKDPHKGPVAIASTVLLILISISFLTLIPGKILYVLYIAEVASKNSCCTSSLIGKEPNYQGLGYSLTRILRNKAVQVIIVDLVSIIISYVLLSIWGALTLIITILISMVVFNHIQGLFNGAVGDLYGFILELSRVIAIISLSLALTL